MITDEYIYKDGCTVSKVQLLYIDEDTKLCDGCDERKSCASVKILGGTVMIICKDCLQEIIDNFNQENL